MVFLASLEINYKDKQDWYCCNAANICSQHGETKTSNGMVVPCFVSVGVEILLFMKQEVNVYCRHPNELPLYYKRNLKLHMKFFNEFCFLLYFFFFLFVSSPFFSSQAGGASLVFLLSFSYFFLN